MRYRSAPPTYEALQWTGDNVEECQEFYRSWWPQDPPPPEWMTDPPPPQFQHNPDDDTLIVKYHGVVNVGDWFVNGGTWVPGGVWDRAAEVVTDTVFGQKYTPIT
jgi:hypothetical protein